MSALAATAVGLPSPLWPVRTPGTDREPTAHDERVSLGREGREANRKAAEPLGADVRWYRAAVVRSGQWRQTADFAARQPAREATSARPVHAGVKTYQRVMDVTSGAGE